jgi:predicted nucleotidyltransferase
MTQNTRSNFLPKSFLEQLVTEFDSDEVTAIILHGSYARGNALPPYSDVDIVRILKETPGRTQERKFLWREGYLLNLTSRPLSIYREWLTLPQQAIFRVSSIRDAQILVDKAGEFRAFQQEASYWQWEPLQPAADAYASQLMVETTEIILKLLKALTLHDQIALSDMITDLFSAVTEAIAVQRGVLIRSGNTYFHQVQEAIGRDSRWTHYHLLTAGISPQTLAPPSIEERGVAALQLYKETLHLVQDHVLPEHMKTIARSIQIIDQVLPDEKIP